jgi:hypothetical protein
LTPEPPRCGPAQGTSQFCRRRQAAASAAGGDDQLRVGPGVGAILGLGKGLLSGHIGLGDGSGDLGAVGPEPFAHHAEEGLGIAVFVPRRNERFLGGRHARFGFGGGGLGVRVRAGTALAPGMMAKRDMAVS